MRLLIKIFLILVLVVSFASVFQKYSIKTAREYSEEVLDKCLTAKEKAKCYDDEIVELMSFVTMETAFEITSLIQKTAGDYPYCHVLGHKLAAIETKKDIEKWKQVVARCPAGVCSNGCVHGAFQEKYRMDVDAFDSFEKALKELDDVCEKKIGWEPSGLERSSCYHALGHLLMYITGGDIKMAIKSCKDIAIKADGDFTSVCFDGAFMQIYQPLEEEDRDLILGREVSKEGVDTFCSQFTGVVKESCVVESWPLYLSEISNPKTVHLFCDKLQGESKNNCYQDVFYLIPIQINFNPKLMRQYCLGFESELREKCASTMASRILEIDYANFSSAISFCVGFVDEVSDYCLESLVDYAQFSISSKKDIYSDFCNQMMVKHNLSCT